METIFISNGETKLILIPERETEKQLVAELMSQGTITVDFVRGPVDVLGTPAQGGILLRSSSTVNDKAETQDV